MARPLRIEYQGAHYHVTSRGNEQRDVFKTLKDREKFLSYLGTATERYGAVIHAWCQLTNHYHLLIETPRGNLSEIMHHINGAYTTYFNVKRKRSSHLFQGRFKAVLVQADQYAKELSRYIHLNPVRAGMVVRPEEYEWSSYRSYIGEGCVPRWLKTGFIHGHFSDDTTVAQKRYRTFVEDKLGCEYESPLKEVYASSILGSEEFIDDITSTYLDKEGLDPNVPALRQLSVHPQLKEIVEAVEAVFGGNKKQTRQASIYFCHRYSGTKLREIGELFSLKDPAIAAGSRRFSEVLERDEHLKRDGDPGLQVVEI